MLQIRTRYVSHPGGSNVGNIRATANGARAEIRVDQSIRMVDNHRAAAEKLARKLGHELAPGDTATDAGYLFLALETDAPAVDVPAETTHFVGRTADGERIYVDIRLGALRTGAETVTTVSHETIPAASALEFSASGFLIEPRRRNASSAGQMLEELTRVTAPAAGWTLADVASLHRVWSRWHLNGMRAACAHMDPATLVREPDGFGRDRIACGAANTCPVSGYTYGAAWLFDALPDGVVREVRRLMSLPTGNVPENY